MRVSTPALTRAEMDALRDLPDFYHCTDRDHVYNEVNGWRMGRWGVSPFGGYFIGWIAAEFRPNRIVCAYDSAAECEAAVEAEFDRYTHTDEPVPAWVWCDDGTTWPPAATLERPA